MATAKGKAKKPAAKKPAKTAKKGCGCKKQVHLTPTVLSTWGFFSRSLFAGDECLKIRPKQLFANAVNRTKR